MFSRAHLLIQRDYEKLQELDLWGISVTQLKDDSLFEWTARILGLKGTAWEGGVFRIYIKFEENYSVRPPEVCFHTIPFHPNVDMITGKPCIDYLDDWSKWNESYGFAYILLTVQSMLSSPVLENAVNPEAVNMIVCSPHSYRQMVQDCVAASQRVDAGVISATERKMKQPKTVEVETIKPDTTPAKSKKPANISFEDYHMTWTGIATSKANLDAKNPLLESIKDNPVLQSAHFGLPIEEIQAQMDKHLQEHSQLVYGKFHDKSKKMTEAELKDARLEKISQMRKIYLQPKTTPRRTPILLEPTRENTLMEPEPSERDVDDLVEWSNNLDEANL